MNACWVSQSVFYEVLNAVNDDVFKRKCLFNEEIMFHSAFKKNTLKVVLLEVKGLISTIVKFRAEQFCVHSDHQIYFWRAWNISYENKCAYLKMKEPFHSAK